ncbi:hypothetical protein LWI29_029155 [Acer saccharum]|uniref:Uncharacterized protein n=1 Tax=Acer saccharum TaxID=4024 RepID=A0AA39SP71_ACESA|nr:hypothetical protein LWI29_029155 [Acer saccharum]
MLSSQLYGSSHENGDQGSALITNNDSNHVQVKGFKKRGGSRGRKRMKSQLEIAYKRKLRQLSNKGSSTATVQAKCTKRKSQASKSTCGRKSTKSTSKASPSSKETTDISINIVPREVDNPLPLPQIPHAVLYNETSSGLQLSTRVQTAVMDNIDQFLALLQDTNTGDNLVSHDVQASALDLNVCAEGFDNFMI